RLPFPFSLTSVRERSAERRYGLHQAPCGAARRLTGTRTSRRSTGGVSPLGPLFRAPDGRSFHLAPIQAGTCAAFHPVHVQPSKAAPILRWARAVVRDDPGSACVSTETRAPHPAPPTKRP